MRIMATDHTKVINIIEYYITYVSWSESHNLDNVKLRKWNREEKVLYQILEVNFILEQASKDQRGLNVPLHFR
jgi:hypothetical protein